MGLHHHHNSTTMMTCREVVKQWRKRYGFADFADKMSLVGDGTKLEVASGRWEKRGFGQFWLVLEHILFGELVRSNIVAGDDGKVVKMYVIILVSFGPFIRV
jgi:hypothetical protein